MNNNSNIHALIGKYVSGQLTKEDAIELSRQIELDPSIIPQIRRNFHADFLLSRKFMMDREALNTFSDSFGKDLPNRNQSFSLDFPFDIDFNEENIPPIRFSEPEEPPQKSFLAKLLFQWFDFDRQKRLKRQNSKPIVYGKKSNFFFVIWIITFIAFISWLSFDGKRKNETDLAPHFVSLGQVQEVVDIVWSKDSQKYKRGQLLGSGRFTLEKGIMKIVLGNGAELFLEGPGDFVFVNQKSCYCEHGKLSAHIPATAQGFEIISPFGNFIDRGTEFYLDVGNRNARMGVVQGKVDFQSAKANSCSLDTGQEIRFEGDLPFTLASSDPDRFMNSKRFLPILENFFIRQKKQKMEKIIRWDSNPDLLVHFDLDHDGKSAIPNISLQGKSQIPQGIPTRISTVPGPLPNTRSFDFSRGSAIRTTIPGEYKNLTLITNIKIEHLSNAANVLFCGENMDSVRGMFLWQITNGNFIQLQISNGNHTIHQIFDSPVCFSRKNRNIWVNMAVVIDADQKRIRHYLDGQLISSTLWKDPIILKMGNATIGNAVRSNKQNEYHLGCALENFMIFDKALSSEEIQEYQTN